MPPRPWSLDYRVAVNVSKKLLKSKSNFQPVVEELVDLDEMFCSAVIVRNKGFIVWAKTWTECINRLVELAAVSCGVVEYGGIQNSVIDTDLESTFDINALIKTNHRSRGWRVLS